MAVAVGVLVGVCVGVAVAVDVGVEVWAPTGMLRNSDSTSAKIAPAAVAR